jgi:uncharacterized membrane protein YbhN (UPF0104 family)
MRIPQRALRFLEVLAALVGIFLLYRVFRQHDAGEIALSLGKIPPSDILVAAGFTACSYACLTIGEYMAVIYASRRRVPLFRVVLTTIASLGIGHSVGLSALSSGAVRYRMYSRVGLDAEAVAKVMLFSGLTVGLGLLTLFCVTMFLHGDMIASFLHISTGHMHSLAAALVVVALLYLFACWRRPPALKVGRARVRAPSALMTAGQMAVGAVNFGFIAAALYVCLAPLTVVEYTQVVTLLIVGDAAAIIGHVPGGWGVLEYIVSSFLTGTNVIAGIVVFRAIYYLIPLAIGVSVLIADEFAGRKRAARIQHDAAIQRG